MKIFFPKTGFRPFCLTIMMFKQFNKIINFMNKNYFPKNFFQKKFFIEKKNFSQKKVLDPSA